MYKNIYSDLYLLVTILMQKGKWFRKDIFVCVFDDDLQLAILWFKASLEKIFFVDAYEFFQYSASPGLYKPMRL